MSVLDIVIFVSDAIEFVQELFTAQIAGWTVWSLILLSWVPLGLPLALLFTRLVYLRHGRPFTSREKQTLALGALGGWFTLTVSVFYIIPLSILFFILTRIFRSRPIKFIVSWLMIPLNLLALKTKEAANKIKTLLAALVEKIIDIIFPVKIS
ncbi:MAG: hypothetical protein A3A97_00835 [Candidatus Terrybacteria bacterium RIFCSPLOWO2_01_FULL_40_23]|uniref:Uncharacterized protein n=1 Tax=Candidatus Terrybacteria bacterium RIFCSPLOWO2_01_FULL_40_23 TaxID=1802366 RepID=A0A1G2PSU8_9BACT|nr:MAG: hypothetical protein A3A97_00835 [Candidatus Terrybacteria bacterium RIFCSPLOWO2_01_FULL_40_23]